jgi:AraC-like DNA-binding protein
LALLKATDELGQLRDESTVLRRAVELVRTSVGLPRVAIFLCGESLDLAQGSWGTGLLGDTTDERDIAFLMGKAHREAIARSNSGLGRWLLLDHAPLTLQVAGKTRVVGYGWNALTPIRSARRPLGLLVSDAGTTGAPVDEGQQTQAVIFCALLGNLLELVRAERRALALTEPAQGVVAGQSQAAAITARAVELLQDNVSLGRAKLARAVGVSESGLSRAFKSQMGLSVSQYRNRLRLERFLSLVDPRGGDLLAAALDAGFGSYAQFHRVFRDVLGRTPKQYLVDPCFANGSRQAARICHGAGTPYVTLDCAPDDLLHGHAAATVISREFALGGCPAQSVMDTLARYAPASRGLTVVTDGARPVVFARAGQVPREVRVPPVDAVSCIGAGDSFRAGIAYGLLREWDDERTVAFAIKVAGAVCSNGPVAASPPALARIVHLAN